MTIGQAVCVRLRDDVTVTAFVATRIYQLKLPQQPTYPAILVTLFEDPAIYHLRGWTNLGRAGLQVDAFANEYDTARPDPYDTVEQLAEAIDRALSGARFVVDDIQVVGSFRSPAPARVPAYDPGDLRVARIQQEYQMTYRTRRVVPGQDRQDVKTRRTGDRPWQMSPAPITTAMRSLATARKSS